MNAFETRITTSRTRCANRLEKNEEGQEWSELPYERAYSCEVRVCWVRFRHFGWTFPGLADVVSTFRWT